MTDKEVVAAALSDPDAQPLTPEQLAKMRRVSRIKVLRQRLSMTQAEFAEAFHLPITTLRDWEQHRGTPDAPARAMLLAIERDPEVMRRLLADKAAQSRRVRRTAERFIMAPRRSNSAHLHQPRRATSEYAIAAKCRRFPDATHQAEIAMTERELNAPQFSLAT
jgi:putative transcriptional regulator